MNAMMAGLAPVMIYLIMGRDMRAMWPGEPLFWMVMSLGIISGFAIAYPVNVWMVSRGMKHGLMTERSANLRMEMPGSAPSGADNAAVPAKKPAGMTGMAHGEMKMAKASSSGKKRTGAPGDMPAAAGSSAPHSGHRMDGAARADSHGMQSDVTRPQLVAVTVFSVLMVLAGMTLPAAFFAER